MNCLNNNKQKVKFGFNHRHYSHIMKAKEIIESGELGDIQWMRGVYGKTRLGNWRRDQELAGHGILVSQGIHMIDLFRYLSNTEFNNVHGFTSHFNKDWYEDNIFGIMKAKNGIVASIHSSCVLGENKFELHIGMEKGYIHVENLITSTRSFGFPESIEVSNLDNETFYGNPEKTVTKYGEDNSWKMEIDEFVNCIIKNKEPTSNLKDCYEVMKIIDKIYMET